MVGAAAAGVGVVAAAIAVVAAAAPGSSFNPPSARRSRAEAEPRREKAAFSRRSCLPPRLRSSPKKSKTQRSHRRQAAEGSRRCLWARRREEAIEAGEGRKGEALASQAPGRVCECASGWAARSVSAGAVPPLGERIAARLSRLGRERGGEAAGLKIGAFREGIDAED